MQTPKASATRLKSLISQLQEDLKKANNQVQSSESCKKQAQQDAEESKQQLLALSSKLEESQQQIPELSISEEARVLKLQEISQDREQAWQSKLEAVQKKHSVDAAALASAVDEIERLKLQLEMVVVCKADQKRHADSATEELQSLKEKLAETLSLVENMKTELKDCKESEAQAQAQVSETLLQLESERQKVVGFGEESVKLLQAYVRVKSKLSQLELQSMGTNHSKELCALKCEVKQLKSALETAETKYHEEQIQSTVQIRNAHDLAEQLRSAYSQREVELEVEVKKTKAGFEELKSQLMDKETELQRISEENEGLNSKLQKSLSCQREYELEKELKELKEHVTDLNAHIMDKETEVQSISKENGMLRLKFHKSEMEKRKAIDDVVPEVEAARCAQREALMKLGIVMEEADKTGKRVTSVTEQPEAGHAAAELRKLKMQSDQWREAAQAASAEMESELRKLKVQSHQWREAAQAASAEMEAKLRKLKVQSDQWRMTAKTAGNGKLMERTASLDSNYNRVTGKISSPYSEDMDDVD